MIDPKMIPPEVVEAAVSAYNYASSDCYTTQEQDMRAAISAGLAAWPGSEISWITGEREAGDLILPLPQEKGND